MTEQEYLDTWNCHEQNQRAEFMDHMYERSGRTNGLYTGLWQKFCLEEAGPYCKMMWFEQQKAVKEFIDQANLRQLETLSLPDKPCKDDSCKETFVPNLHD